MDKPLYSSDLTVYAQRDGWTLPCRIFDDIQSVTMEKNTPGGFVNFSYDAMHNNERLTLSIVDVRAISTEACQG